MTPTRVEPESVQQVDSMLAAVGLRHGRRATRKGVTVSNLPEKKTQPRAASGELLVLQAPAWDAYPWLLHGFSSRAGGHSVAYSADRATGELNLGYTAGDARSNVDRNRQRLAAHLCPEDGRLPQLVTLKQIHSGLIRRVTRANAAAMSTLQGDGLITDRPGLMLAIQTADCVPVLLVDPANRAVGAFHAGWRGAVRRIVERGVGLMRAQFGSDPSLLRAAIGPAIGQCCYSVGEEVVAEFSSQFVYSRELFREVYDSDPIKLKYPLLFLTARAPGHSDIGPQTHLDLAEANRRQLLDAGLQPHNIWVSGECTQCHPEKYFSHRGEQGFTGRMLSVIGVRPL